MSTTNAAQRTIERRKFQDSEFSITESELLIADKNDAVKALRIEKVGEVHHVFAQLTWRKEELVLTTTRTSVKPRAFKHIGRLVDYIRKTCPSIMHFNVKIAYAGDRNRRTTRNI